MIFGEGKSADQIAEIAKRMAATGVNLLITRLAPDKARLLKRKLRGLDYRPDAQIGMIIREPGERRTHGTVMVLSAGTSDLPVAEEAALCAEVFGNPVERLYDVGVAGMHRLTANVESIQRASVLIVVAGMEGALPSVVAGLSGQAGDRGADQRRLWRFVRRYRGAARDAQQLCEWSDGGEYRQRLRRGFRSHSNQSGRARARTRLMAASKDITSGRARRAIKIGGLASQVGSSYLWTSLRRPFLSTGRYDRELLDTHLKNARRIVEGSQAIARRLHEADSDALDPRGYPARRSARYPEGDAVERAANGLCADREADSPRILEISRATIRQLRTRGVRRRFAWPGASRAAQDR